MNRVLFILVLISVLFTNCSKIEKAKKRIDGTWNAVTYKHTSNLGFSYFYTAEGVFNFDNCSEDICSYSIDIDYSNSTASGSKSEYGKYFFVDEKGDFFNFYRTEINGVDTLDYGRIILLTKSDLKIEYDDSTGRHTYVLEK